MRTGAACLDIAIIKQCVMESSSRCSACDQVGECQPACNLTQSPCVLTRVPLAGWVVSAGKINQDRLSVAQDRFFVLEDRYLPERIKSNEPLRLVLASRIVIHQSRLVTHAQQVQ